MYASSLTPYQWDLLVAIASERGCQSLFVRASVKRAARSLERAGYVAQVSESANFGPRYTVTEEGSRALTQRRSGALDDDRQRSLEEARPRQISR